MSRPRREGSRDTGEGIIVSLTPDVCKTPVGSSMVPIPYSITAVQGDDANTVATVRYTGKRAHNMASLVTKCSGDAPGTGTGVKSGTVGSICEPKSHSNTVRVRGEWAVRHNDEWWMNKRNTVGKLTYVKSAESFEPTPGIILARSPQLEAPTVEDAGRMYFVFPEGTPAPPAQSPPTTSPSPNEPNRVARPPTPPRPYTPSQPPSGPNSAWSLVDGAWKLTKKGGVFGPALGLFFMQNSPHWWRDEMPANLDDPIERGLLDLADEAMEGGADIEDVGDWLRREIENYREQQAETQTEVEADITTDTVGVTDEEAQRRCSTETICFMPISEDVDREEFRRQLKLQERALNGMTPGEMLANRAAYLANPAGMRALSEPLQARTRAEYRASLEDTYEELYGLIEGPIKLAEHMDTVAALHNPDMIAGGLYASVADPSIPLADRIGGFNENSSMGSQWRGSRSQRLANHARRQAANRCPTVQVILEVCPSVPGSAGTPVGANGEQ